MDDELEEFRRLLKSATPPEPGEDAKNDAIFKAMAAFDQKYAVPAQGNGFTHRLMDRVMNFHHAIVKGLIMKKGYLLAGGLCVGALAVALMNTSYLTDIVPLPVKQEQVSASLKTQMQEVNQKDKTARMDIAPADMPVPSAAPMPPIPTEKKPQALNEAASARMEKKAVLQSPMLGGPAGVMNADSLAPLSKMAGAYALADASQPHYHDEGRDKFETFDTNAVKLVKNEPVSTFSVDVDTSSYSFLRASLNNNVLPQHDAVRIEEMINYFPYDYEVPKDKAEPFKANIALMPTPWNKDTKLLRIGVKGYQLDNAQKPHANLVFLIDTSGSMDEPNKLPLLKNSFKLLLEALKPDDTVAIVTYAGNAGIALEPTKAGDKQKIIAVLDSLGASGSTAGAEGIRTAYQLAEQHLEKEGVNRVLLATDGDFNVGITNQDELKSYIVHEREKGVSLSVLGFGMGNYNDAVMQALAQNGNGNAAYIDNLNEARKVLVEEAGSTLFTIAKDVKIQVEFNPEQVSEYRLIGYESRMLKREDFNNDKVDAGDIGAGHAVTALYEITPAGSKTQQVDELRYDQPKVKSAPAKNGEYAFVKIRYKLPDGDTSKLMTTPVDSKAESANIEAAPQEARFAAAVAAFGQMMHGEAYTKDYSYDDIIALAESSKGKDEFGYRSEFINLVRLAKTASAMPSLQQ